MPTDIFNIPFQYASKPGGFFYQMEADPENSNFADWPPEMSFPGSGKVIMEPQGATDFGLGKNIASFSDAIGGCDMSFADTVARGYMFKADDPRDLEIKCICQFDGIQSGNDMSISSRSGHHTGDGCCQGFAYMFGYDCNTNEFRFRKEMWHVSYHESPEGSFSHSAVTADYNGGKKIGLGLTIYNKPGTNNTRVVLEGWCNPDPTANIANWIMVKRIEDFSGNGWGDDGGDCDGEDDQFGPWSGPQSRFKTNSSGGSITFEAVSMREIDPSRALDDTSGGNDPGGNPLPPPPPPGGGGTAPSTISPVITYMMVSTFSTSTTGPPVVPPLQRVTRAIAARMVDAIVDPDTFARFSPSGWKRTGNIDADINQAPCGSGIDVQRTYPDGLAVATYWSNSANVCIAPGLANGTAGTNANDVINHGGRIMKNPHIHLIFWGGGRTDWNARTESPTMNQIITEVRDKLLRTDKQYFSGIQQYGAPGTPVWGTGGGGAGDPPPTNSSELVVPLPKFRDANDSRPIINVQMKQPNGQWSANVLFNFDSGASQETYIPLQLLSAFGYGANGSETGTPQNITIRIPGLVGEYTITCKVQNKAHYDLQRSQPAPIRYPLIRLYDLLPFMSFVHTKDEMIIRTAVSTIPELTATNKIVLPNMATRAGTPTSGKQWMHVDFINPANTGDNVDDWFGLNTGDQRIIVRKNISDDINLTLRPPVDGDAQEHDATCNIRFKEATPSTLISDNQIVVRDETADFGSGGGPRSFGSGFNFLNKYKMVFHGSSLQRELIPITTQIQKKMSVIIGLASNGTKGGLTVRQTCNLNWGEEMIEGMTDPFMESWHAESTQPEDPFREIGDDPCDVSKGGDLDTYSDGLGVDSYWSNSDHDCIIPGKSTTSPPGVNAFPNMTYHGGAVMKNPKIYLIFWGADWLTRSATPTKAQLISDIQTKLLVTDTQYFNKLSQYGAPGIPVWGGAVQNNNIPLSSDPTEVINKAATAAAAGEDLTAAIAVIKNTINTGLIPLAGIDFDNTQFIVVPEFGRTSLWYGSVRTYTNIIITHASGSAFIQTSGPETIPGEQGGQIHAHNIAGYISTPNDTFTPTLVYCAVSLITTKATAASVTNLQWTDMMLSEELIEAQTDTEGDAWYGDTLEDPDEEPIREIGDNPCDLDSGSFKGTYASGLSVMAYWSNSHANCIIPGITATDIGDSTAISFHGGRIMKNPVLRLIFWGTEWTTQTSPTMAEVIAEVQTKLLVTNATFFSGLNQYSGCGTPTYGSAVQNTTIPYPIAGAHTCDRAAIEAVIKDSLNTALLPVSNPATMQHELYIVFLAKNKTITTDQGLSVDGYHKTLQVTFPN